MTHGELFYLPLALPFFALLFVLFVFLVVLLQVGVLKYAYTRLGVSAGAAYLLLVGSLLGSYFNIPIGELPGRRILAGEEISFYGVHYLVPLLERSGTIIAVNVGGAVIPGFMSLYLLGLHRLWAKGALATAVVAAFCHLIARPVPGFGIVLPIFAPAAVTALVALALSPRQAAPLAYISGSLGVLIGADLLNLGKLHGLGAPVASIGGAGAFDGIFLCGILAVLFASFTTRGDDRGGSRGNAR
ncbi:DUF1614 domain-containing protein [Rhodoblastus sp.]|uniref:DUF1614 domain-containing protein n=1 Tax=Rhodoblastus sp. TaxID=1962975 RepID=UPI00260EED1B|nr:DUF1614 domain-containing protein [Rhodoblastus sp.]